VRGWGGVSLVYRRGLTESPAYRLNHEEVTKALEEGIRFIERLNPVEALPDASGAVHALRFERMVTVDGKLKGSGQFFELPARTVCVAAGTSPNVTYEKEYPGTFQLDARGEYFQGHELVEDGDGFALKPVAAREDPGAKAGFFTSYRKAGHLISFYGDNHPTYAGNVVKAMASACTRRRWPRWTSPTRWARPAATSSAPRTSPSWTRPSPPRWWPSTA
jgi:NADPH-dependent glutamate synthase beta subunit-like oxidoreductase